MKSNSTFQTEKLTWAAYLISAGKAKLVRAEPIPGTHNVTFILEGEPGTPTQEDLSGFFTGTAQVSALRFSEVITSLKAISYEARKNG